MARPFLMDATVPRPAPRIPIVPTPFTYEKPTPQVPDLSLIFDSSPSNNQNSSSSLLPPSSRDHSTNRLFPYNNNNNNSACTTSPQNSNMNKPMTFEVQVLYDIVKRQEEIITRMDNQIKHLVETQDNSFKSLIEHQDTQFEIIQDTLLKLLELSQQQKLPKIAMTKLEQGVQTDSIVTTTTTTTSDKDYGTDRMIHKPIHKANCSNVNNAINTRKDSPTVQNQQQQQKQNLITTAINTPSKLPNIERSRSASGSSSSSSSSSSGNSHKNDNSSNNNNNRKDAIASSSNTNTPNSGSNSPFNTQAQGNNNNKNIGGRDQQQQEQQQQQYQYRQLRAPFGNSDFQYENNHSADFSGILKDIQLPTIRESSLFSEASIQPINLQDYNDSLNESDSENPHIGPSVSAYGTSDDDDDEEVVQPTPTFYQNILGNVNKMLENNRTEATLYGSTDTTVYGMSSNNLSFATKEYLQRYGLVKPKKPTPTATTTTNNNNNNNGKKQQQQYGIPESNRIFSNEEVPNNNNNNNNNRILDMTALRNQPKLL